MSAEATSVCAICDQPLLRRGSGAVCVRCLAGFLVVPDGLDGSGKTTQHYGHFEVLMGEDGWPLELGRGAMGTTYRARDTVLNRAVALKVIEQSVAALPVVRARFLREAQAAARFHHPNVASVLHYGEQEGECFYVMELVAGETLAERVRRDGPLPPTTALEIAVQVAHGLAAAEAQGIVHRDLKPGNIMWDVPAGDRSQRAVPTVKVIDFGLAKAVNAGGGGPEDTRGGFAGTPAFASPEQFIGSDDGRVDTRSDIYSLGVTLWYLLTGKLPFVGQTLAEIHKQQTRQPLPWDQLKVARVPKAVASLLRSMMSAAPSARPQSARELLAVLERCRRSLPPPEVRRRHRRLLIGGGTVLFVFAGTWLYQATRPPLDRSIVVLPFDNLSPNPADGFFTVGTQDEITADLARVKDLRVIGSNSTRSYPPGNRDLMRISRELGVAHLLEGSLRREGGKVHLGLRLVDIHDPDHPWTKEYDRQVADVFAVQGEVTRAIAERLDAKLSASEKAAVNRPPTTDLIAYDLYLRAKEGPQIFKSPGDVRRAYSGRIPLLDAAVSRDPGFAFAYCELARLHDGLYRYRFGATAQEQTVDHRSLAETALANARRLRPDAGEMHFAQAAHFHLATGDDEQARIEVDLAREALPNNSAVEELAGEIARGQNRWDEAIRCLEKAVALDPRENVNRFTLANTYRLSRHYDEFDRQMDQLIATMTAQDSVAYRLFRTLGSVEQRADLVPLRSALASVTLTDEPSGELKSEYGLVLAMCAHDADAISRILAATSQSSFPINHIVYPRAWYEAFVARMRQDRPAERTAFAAARIEVSQGVQSDLANGSMLSLLAVIDAGLGNKETAVQEARRAYELCSARKEVLTTPIAVCNLAVVYAWTGEPDLACEVLERWIGRPAGTNFPAQPTYGDLRLDPLWEPLEGNVRFQSLIERLAPQETR